MLWDMEETSSSPMSSLLASKPASRFRLQAGASGHALPALPWGPQIAPNSCQAPHLLPQVSPQEGHAEASTRSPHGLR